MTQQAYVAFLRSINLGGQRVIKMKALCQLFESLEFTNVKSFLASGNVFFRASIDENPLTIKVLTGTIESAIEKTFGFKVEVIIRSIPEIQNIIKLNPFKGRENGRRTQLFVTFLYQPTTSNLKLPYISSNQGFEVVRATKLEVFSLAFVDAQGKFASPFSFIDKQFGSGTTRTWGVITRMIDYANQLEGQ